MNKSVSFSVILFSFVFQAASAFAEHKSVCTISSLKEYEKKFPGLVRLNEKLQPKLLRKVDVKIPESVKSTKANVGPTILAVTVNTEGNLTNICILRKSSRVEWDTAAIDSVSQWRYAPIKNGDKVVSASLVITVRTHYR